MCCFVSSLARSVVVFFFRRGEIIGNAVADKREKLYENMQIGSDYMFRVDEVSGQLSGGEGYGVTHTHNVFPFECGDFRVAALRGSQPPSRISWGLLIAKNVVSFFTGYLCTTDVFSVVSRLARSMLVSKSRTHAQQQQQQQQQSRHFCSKTVDTGSPFPPSCFPQGGMGPPETRWGTRSFLISFFSSLAA